MNLQRASVIVGLSLISLIGLSATAQNGPWQINVRDVLLTEFVEEVASITGRTFVVDPRIRGTVTVISDVELDKQGVYELLLSVLRTQEYSLIENGDILEIIQSTRARMQGGARQDNEPSLPGAAWVTQVIDAGHLDPNEIIKALRQLAPQHAQFSGIVESNAVLITDRKQNIDGMLRIVDQLKSAAGLEFATVNLEHSWAVQVVESLTALLDENVTTLKVIANPASNSLILRGTERDVMMALGAVSLLDQPANETSSTRVFRLRQAVAENVAGLLENILQSSGAASATAPSEADHMALRIASDESLNAVVVKANPAQMQEIQVLIDQLDQRRAQVLIEAAIVEVSVDDSTSFGVELGAADAEGEQVPAVSTSLDGVLSGLLTRLSTSADGEEPALSSTEIVANLSTPSLAIAKLDPDGLSFGAVISALAQTTYANFLSTPSVMALNNEESSFLVGQTVPFRSGNLVFPNQDGLAGIRPTDRGEIGTTLVVTPSIHEDLSVRLTISQTVENIATPTIGIGDSGFADIVTNKREIKTVVLADNQQTIVLGGLIQDEKTQNLKKVPLLGSIPLLGRLFQSKQDTNRRSLLVVFIRPTVVVTPEEASQATQKKYQDLLEIDFSQEEVKLRSLDQLFEGFSN